MTRTKKQTAPKKTLKHVYFTNITACGCSIYGNPRYELDVITDDGSTYHGKTASNAAIAYGIRNFEGYHATETHHINGEEFYKKVLHVRAFADVTYHVTRTGNIIFDYARPAEQ